MIDDDDVRLEILDTAGQVRSYADVSRPGDGGVGWRDRGWIPQCTGAGGRWGGSGRVRATSR